MILILYDEKMFVCLLLANVLLHLSPTLSISEQEAERVAMKMWENECKGTITGLTSWNEGEEFASFGLAHFIWYPENTKGPFNEQFPEFLRFAKNKNIAMPEWLKSAKDCPWTSKREFYQNFHSQKMVELRNFLHSSLALQACFIARKLENVLPKITHSLNATEKEHVIKMFYWVANDPHGIYPLADYLNFKGDGVSPTERYSGKGWGLLQVLQNMSDDGSTNPLEEFVAKAKSALCERVKNAPAARGETRWLEGWYHRLDTYLKI